MADNNITSSKDKNQNCDSSSDESTDRQNSQENLSRRNPYRKVVVEKRSRSESSHDSDKENKRKCFPQPTNEGDSSASESASWSPLYQNQMADPRVQSLVWQQNLDQLEQGYISQLKILV